MTLTRYPTAIPSDPDTNYSNTPDLAILNVSRLFARLEHNLLAPTADLRPLRRDEYQRMRVGANIEYARTTLLNLEKSLPGIKPVDRRHEIQTDVTRKRQVLKSLQGVLEEVTAQAQAEGDEDEDEDFEEGGVVLDDEGEIEKGIHTPEVVSEKEEEQQQPLQEQREELKQGEREVEAPTTTTKQEVTTTSPPTSTLRNRHHQHQPTAMTTATPTPTQHHPPEPISTPDPTKATTEQSLSSNRLEQESLTDSLLSLATQLKSSSTAFHTSLEAEKSVLDRAVDGLDATTANMGTAEKRMGMLRKMTEGKGWWGRMMLYAWILGLWVVAILIVFLGPKLRF